MHTHGLHVSPSGNADNIFLVIPPGRDHDLEIPVPADHTGGMFWYHPHHHGGVTQSLRAGMAGALIVRGDFDRVPEVAAAKEQIMIVQALDSATTTRCATPTRTRRRTVRSSPRTGCSTR
ncbi:MAG: multicopper oxidase domain-containing protein [Streptosporangiaceae bacterium]